MRYRHIVTGVEVESGIPLDSTIFEPVKRTRKKEAGDGGDAGGPAGRVENPKRKRARQG